MKKFTRVISDRAAQIRSLEATYAVDPDQMDSSGKSFVRYAEPGEIADAVAFLARPCAKFINGQVIRVDGGLALFPG